MKKLKKYLPDPKTIPAIMVIAAVGTVVVSKALPRLIAWVAEKTPTLGGGAA
jgi:hypothetical protein